jgi:hypothetical protein
METKKEVKTKKVLIDGDRLEDLLKKLTEFFGEEDLSIGESIFLMETGVKSLKEVEAGLKATKTMQKVMKHINEIEQQNHTSAFTT